MIEPNDIIVRVTRTDAGYRREVLIAINDEAMLLEMQRLASYLHERLALYGQSDASVEYHAAVAAADKLAVSVPRIKPLS